MRYLFAFMSVYEFARRACGGIELAEALSLISQAERFGRSGEEKRKSNARAMVHVVEDDQPMRSASEDLFDSVGLDTQSYAMARGATGSRPYSCDKASSPWIEKTSARFHPPTLPSIGSLTCSNSNAQPLTVIRLLTTQPRSTDECDEGAL